MSDLGTVDVCYGWPKTTTQKQAMAWPWWGDRAFCGVALSNSNIIDWSGGGIINSWIQTHKLLVTPLDGSGPSPTDLQKTPPVSRAGVGGGSRERVGNRGTPQHHPAGGRSSSKFGGVLCTSFPPVGFIIPFGAPLN